MYKTILCATDGSTSAAAAVGLAADLAKAFKSRLIYLHVAQPGRMNDALRRLAESENITEADETHYLNLTEVPDWFDDVEELNARVREDLDVAEYLGRRYLADAEEVAKKQGVSGVQTMIERGEPADEIVRVAKHVEADAIVLGARGLSDLKSLLLGSVSHKVAHLAPCTCITVR